MKYIRWIVLLALLSGAVIVVGMAKYDWVVGGKTWTEVKEGFLPNKTAFEDKREKYYKQAVDEAEGR